MEGSRTTPLCNTPDQWKRHAILYGKTSPHSSSSAQGLIADSNLPERIKEAYSAEETDAVLDLSRSLPLDTISPRELVTASIEAGEGSKRHVSGILNAWIAAGCLSQDTSFGARWAWELLLGFDDVAESVGVGADVVTLSLVYAALCRAPESTFSTMADSVLDRARRLSKKAGGSKRRRALAASRRKGPSADATDVEAELQKLCGLDFHVLYESDHLLIVSKPSGTVCFHRRKTTAGKIRSSRRKKGRPPADVVDISLEDALLHFNIPLSTLNHEGRGIVHRIDRGTSGCIILAKTDEMHAKLLTEFFLRRVQKSYLAVVVATKDIPTEGTINIPVHGRPAQSSFNIIEKYGDAAMCLRVETSTGRKHQVRIHCAQGLGQPILLDPLYGNESCESDFAAALIGGLEKNNKQHFFLHASKLRIPEFDVQVEAPLPGWWREAVSTLKQDNSHNKSS